MKFREIKNSVKSIDFHGKNPLRLHVNVKHSQNPLRLHVNVMNPLRLHVNVMKFFFGIKILKCVVL